MRTYVIVKKFYADGPSMYEFIVTSHGTSLYMPFKRLKDAKAFAQVDAGRTLVWTSHRSGTVTEYQGK
jgi:hypothetical protein